jgi:signal peptidase II
MTPPVPETDSPAPARAPAVLSRGSRCWQFLVLTLLLVAADQASKLYAVQTWKGMPAQSFFLDVFRIEYAQNHGAFLSMMSGASGGLRFFVLQVLNGAVLVGIAVSLLWPRTVSAWTFYSLTLIVAGGIGNLIDRVQYEYVIDFLNLGLGSLRTGIFNIADVAITAGFFLMLPAMLQKEPRQSTTDSESSRNPPSRNSEEAPLAFASSMPTPPGS